MLAVIKGNKTIYLVGTIDAVQGLAPKIMNSLEKLATALNNDSNFFNTVTTALNDKADKSTTFIRSVVNALLDAKVDDTEMVNYAAKADTFTKAEVNDKFTNIIAGAPDALNSQKELSDVLGSNLHFSTTVLHTLNNKQTSQTFTAEQK